MDFGVQAFLVVLLIAFAFLILKTIGVVRQKRAVEIPTGVAPPVAVNKASSFEEEEVMTQLAADLQKSSPLSKVISKIVTEEVQKKTLEKTVELRERFDRVIEEKNKKLDIAVQQVKVVSERYEKLDATYKELGEEKKQTEEIVHSMAEGVIMVNKKGEVLLMNPAAERLLGVKKEDKIGKSVLNDLKEEQLVSMVQQPAEGAKSKEIVIQSQNDQVKKVLLASNAVIESEDGKTVGFVSVISDVTKQKELEAMKNEFLANVSHDLRTPITSIRGSLQILSESDTGSFTSSQKKHLEIVLRNIDRLSRLLNDLLDLSKLEAKKFSIRPAPFRADELIRSLMHEFGAWSTTKGITVKADVESPLEIEADQDRIGQVLINLIGNALKFTPGGGTVTIVGKRTPDLQNVEFGVRDTGPGIAAQDLQKLFEKFSRVENKTTQGIKGTGLGLTISREIVELHGGRIWIESEEGKGSYFVFQVPIKSISAGSSAAA